MGRFSCVVPAGTSRLMLTVSAADWAPADCGEIAESVPKTSVNPAMAANGFRHLLMRTMAHGEAFCDRANLDRQCEEIFVKIRGMGKTPFPTVRRTTTVPSSPGLQRDFLSVTCSFASRLGCITYAATHSSPKIPSSRAKTSSRRRPRLCRRNPVQRGSVAG